MNCCPLLTFTPNVFYSISMKYEKPKFPASKLGRMKTFGVKVCWDGLKLPLRDIMRDIRPFLETLRVEEL